MVSLIFGGSGIVPAAIMAIALNILLPKDEAKPEEVKAEAAPEDGIPE